MNQNNRLGTLYPGGYACNLHQKPKDYSSLFTYLCRAIHERKLKPEISQSIFGYIADLEDIYQDHIGNPSDFDYLSKQFAFVGDRFLDFFSRDELDLDEFKKETLEKYVMCTWPRQHLAA